MIRIMRATQCGCANGHGGDGFAASQQMLCPSAAETPQTYTDVDAKLQIAAAFLSGRIAASHIQTVASHLLQAVSGLVRSCGVVSAPAADLTSHLGEPTWKEVSFLIVILIVFFERCGDMHQP